MQIQVIVSQMTVLFILLAVGLFLGKLKVISADGNRTLTNIVLYAALPCTILNSVFGTDTGMSLGDTLYFLLMCFLSFALAFAIAIPLVHLSRSDKSSRGLLTFMSVFSNCGFMGFPVTLAVFGVAAGFYTAIFNIPFNVLSFSVGVMLVAGGAGNISLKKLLNPPLIASLLAIPIALSGFKPHDIISDTVKIIGGITTPGAMIVIGCSLSFIPFRNVFSQWRIWLTTTLRLIIIPLATWFIFRFFIDDAMVLGVLVILSAMPTAAQSAMLAIRYDGDETVASAGVFASTLLCVITIPILTYLLF